MSQTLVPEVVAGRYTIRREVGRGATATVYAAFDARLGREVALKVLLPELAQSHAMARFEVEARRMARLHHRGPHLRPERRRRIR